METKQSQAVAYYRVSTQKQGASGLGMDAQKHAVKTFLSNGSVELLASFAEVESGKRKDRPELAKAIELCRKTKARLVIAKLDRLARNASFTLALRDAGIDFVCCDMPNADRFTIGILALVAEREAQMTSERTRNALAAARRRGVKLGNPKLAEARKRGICANMGQADAFAQSLKPVIAKIRKQGVTAMEHIATCLNSRGLKTRTGKPFCGQIVKNLLARL